jgi:hypothetical protein
MFIVPLPSLLPPSPPHYRKNLASRGSLRSPVARSRPPNHVTTWPPPSRADASKLRRHLSASTMDFFRDEEECNMNPTPPSNHLDRDLFPEVNSSLGRGQGRSSPGSARMEGFDLNSDGTKFPNLSSYQEIL